MYYRSQHRPFHNALLHQAYEKNNNIAIPVNIYETEKAFEIELMVPGRNKTNFTIQSENGLLTVEYNQPTEQKETNNKILQKQFAPQSFKKVFSLPENIQTDNIEAAYTDGILKISLPLKAVKTRVAKNIAVA
ncbi:Hsp20/alpha crystallin family protein [Hydrotalea sp.]|uniref:Hsp20/alpha crystallin family protein n=1 Tax=Hydrotalea sp. TaxID=2881279 RepID=UPI003D1193E5